jgi:hypothetical protein
MAQRRGGRSKTDRSAGKWKLPFLAAFARSGNIRSSAQAANVDRAHVYRTFEQDEKFRADFDDAKDEAISLLEATLRDQAMSGHVTALIFLLKSLDPQTYNDRVQVTGANSGPVEMVATMKLSDKQ